MNLFAPGMGITVSTHNDGTSEYLYLPPLSRFESILTVNESIIHFENGSSFGIFLNENNTFLSLDDNIVSEIDWSILQNASCASYDPVNNNTRLLELLPVPFFPNCFPDDIIPHFLDISVVVDQSLYKFLDSNIQSVTDYVAIQLTKTRLLYRRQFNLILRLSYLYISTPESSDPFPLSSCSYTTTDVLQAFAAWNKATKTSSKAAHTHLLTNCWPPPGVVGIAYLASLCEENINVAVTSHISYASTWLIFAHELGHSLGARHTFGYGGIMDYGNPRVDDVIQFHPNNLPEVCPELTEKYNCKYIQKDLDTSNQCGNGILEKDEQCECIDMSSNCGLCVECILHPKLDDECSTSTYVVRPPNTDPNEPLGASPELFADPKCCTEKGLFLSANTDCDQGKVCSIGKCVRMCSTYSLPACDITENGCRQPCQYYNVPVCRDDIQTQSKKFISYMQNGSICEKGNKRGECIDGVCNIPGETPIPSTIPTSQPTETKKTCAPTLNEKRCNMIRSRYECNSLKRCIFKVRTGKCGSKCSFFN